MARTIFCSVCDVSIKSKAFSAHLKSNLHKNNASVNESDGIIKVSSAFRSRIASYRVLCGDGCASDSVAGADQRAHPPAEFLLGLRRRVRALISARMQAHTSLKVNFELFGEFGLPKDDTVSMKSFATENITLHQSYDFNDMFSKVIETICHKIGSFEDKNSGWAFIRNLYLEININKYNPLRASSYIELPKIVKSKRACINIQNADNYCFLWCIMASLFPAKNNAHRTSAYPHFEGVLNTKNMTFPVGFSDIRVFEKNNPNISVNIYGLKNNSNVVGPLYRSLIRKKHHVNLLLIESGKRTHYCLIKNLPKLLRQQLTRHHAKIYFCEDCMIFFDNDEKLKSHVCSGVATILPKEGTLIQFQHYERMHDMPFVIYADFESILKPTASDPKAEGSSSTTTLQQHVPAAFAYYIVCSYDSSLNKYVSYRGPDCVEQFVHHLQSDVTIIHRILNLPVPISLTDEDENNFAQAYFCYICDRLLFDDKVRDHCHLTGRYRGAAHSYCNIQFRLPKFVPVFFHNLAGYDCHLFIRNLGEMLGKIKVIAKNKENYISFTKFFQVNEKDYIPVRLVNKIVK